MAKENDSRYTSLVRDCYRSGGYVFARRAGYTGEDDEACRVARLASNENPRPPSPLALERGCQALREVNRYPDERMADLVRALEKFHGQYHFVTGVGMDGVIETVIRTLVCPGERVAVSTPTFSFYGLAAMAQGAEVVNSPRRPDFSVDVHQFVRSARDAKISFLCTPNNPTGNVTSRDDVEEILSAIHGVLFLDNAYVEFCDEDYRPLMNRYENLILGRTFSKVFSLAGLRVGYAFVPLWLVPCYLRAATPFTVNSVSAAAATGALADRLHLKETVEGVKRLRELVVRECKYPVFHSGANFVMVDVSPSSGREMADRLAERGVLVRSCESFPGLGPHYIRVSIGEEWENARFLDVINAL
ncbi:MAG TPA: histidinol-phosphate transaminase [Methanolinea sp.]|nr:histidinol-phosphate transaminase [Methanolinea sp.]